MRRGAIVRVVTIGLLAAAVATAVALLIPWLPAQDSEEADRIDFVFWVVVAICIVLLILAFLAPRLSRYPQRGVQKTYGAGGNAAGKAPGKLGTWLRKPFDSANKWTGKSGAAGRRGRDKAPF